MTTWIVTFSEGEKTTRLSSREIISYFSSITNLLYNLTGDHT